MRLSLLIAVPHGKKALARAGVSPFISTLARAFCCAILYGCEPCTSVSQKRAAAQFIVRSKGIGGAATNKQKGVCHNTGIACRFCRFCMKSKAM